MEAHEIRKKIRGLEIEIGKERKEGRNTNRAMKLERDKEKLCRDMEKINHGLSMSDHALVRYFERVMGFDVGKIRENILKHVSGVGSCNGRYKIADDIYIYVKDKTIVTVIDANVDFKVG